MNAQPLNFNLWAMVNSSRSHRAERTTLTKFMKSFAVFILGVLSLVSTRGAVASSADYQLTMIGLDSGGGHGSSANYTSDVSFGLTVGRSSATLSAANTLGFVAQFNNPPIAMDDLRSHVFD